jgi:serine/tyrosine/threonine adenylyltransferase
MKFNVSNIFTKELPQDSDTSNQRRQVLGAAYSTVYPRKCSNPKLIAFSKEVANMVGVDEKDCNSQDFVNVFSGNLAIDDAVPYAMCYGGHQFGHWAGQLGDGRAINIADVMCSGAFMTLQLKGAGPTPYSRSADGLAVMRSSIREFLCSEAMHYLGIPTTRALSIVSTGDQVLRDVIYDGNAAYEPGAVVCRVAPNFIRFGNFEIFAARQDFENLKALTDFTIKHFFKSIALPSKPAYIDFLRQVSDSTLDMIIHWQRVGFVHGVMNTDNMSILGITIDYGPYGWLEDFDLQWTPNTTDGEGKRYAYGNQPNIALWNIMKLMNALYPLIEDVAPLQEIFDEFNKKFSIKFTRMMADKLGFEAVNEDIRFQIKSLIDLMQKSEIDFTIFFRNLSQLKKDDALTGIPPYILEAFYSDTHLHQQEWTKWLQHYQALLMTESRDDKSRALLMNTVNPKYVLRNYMAHEAIELAQNGDNSLVNDLLQLLKNPYDEQVEHQRWFAKRPDWAKSKVGCSMLSCSS